MPIQRQTAVRSRIVDLVSGDFVKKEGMEPSYVTTPAGEEVSRAMLVGTVVGRFDSDDGNFSSVTVDDSTGNIRAKVWRETEPLKGVSVGQLVRVIGKVREYEGEIYVVPEIVRQVTADEEALARLEILKRMKSRGTAAPSPAPAVRPSMPASPTQDKPAAGEEEKPQNAEPAEKPLQEQPAQQAGEFRPASEKKEESPRQKVLGLIEKQPEGMKYSDLAGQAGIPEEELENVINELLGEGVCYEPLPGKIKKI